MGLHQVVKACDLHGCTLENTARYAPDDLKLVLRSN